MKYYKWFSVPLFGKIIRDAVIKKEGGEKISTSLRKYCEEKKVIVGMHTYGSCFSAGFNTGGTVEIGRYCSFGPSVRYFGANHPIYNAVMSPYFYNKSWGGLEVRDVDRSHLNIGNDVWIGASTIITSGCKKIGNGAVIGAGAVVTKDVAPYEIVAGNPAHKIKMRFNDEIIHLLEKSQWWELEPSELYKYYNLMETPEEFAHEIILSKQ